MFNRGDKLEINPSFQGILEIIGTFPAGQGNYTETHYQIMVNGYRLMLPQSIIGDSGLLKKITVEAPVVVAEELNIITPPAPLPEVKEIKHEKKGKKK